MSISWDSSLGGSGKDIIHSMIKTQEGGYALVGETLSSDGDINSNHGGRDAWIALLHADGQLKWLKTYGGSQDEVFFDLVQTNDGGFAAAGYTFSTDGDVSSNQGAADCWVVRVDSGGQILWEKNLGGSSGESALSLVSTIDGGFVLAGYTYSSNGEVSSNKGYADVWIVKLNFLGIMQWQYTYGGSEDDWATDIINTTDGGFGITGWTASSNGDVSENQGADDVWFLKLSAIGNIQWQKTYGGTKADHANAIIQANDGGYILAGYAKSDDGDVIGHHGNADVWVVKTDPAGEITWQNALGGVGEDLAADLVQLSDGTIAVAGRTFSTDGDVSHKAGFYDIWLTELNVEGALIWEFAFGGSQADYAHCIISDNAGGYIVAGETASIDGDISTIHGGTDGWVVHTRPWSTALENEFASQLQLRLGPNPASDQIHLSFFLSDSKEVTLSLMNMRGKRLLMPFSGRLNAGQQHVDIFSGHLSTGIYILRLQIGQQQISRMIQLR